MDTTFSRLLLKEVVREVRSKGITNPGKAWVWTSDRRTWEFHYNEFYTCFRASDAYEARAKGWEEYLRTFAAKKT